VLSACGITLVHPESPRVFFWNERLFTEGVLDYLRRRHLVSDSDANPTVSPSVATADDDVLGQA